MLQKKSVTYGTQKAS